MLKVLETAPNRLVIKEKRSNFDAIMLGVFICVPIYFLFISTLKMWTRFGVKESLVEFIYNSVTHPPLVYFTAIGLFLFPAALGFMLIFGSWFPTRTFIFDRKSNLLTIKSTCLCWHHKTEYSLDEIQTLRWFPQSVYAGGMTMVEVQELNLIRRKQNGKTHLIPIRHTVHPKHRETSTVVDLIHRFLASKS